MTARAIALPLIAALALSAVGPSELAAQPLPRRVGACALTRVKAVEERLEDGDHTPVPGSGSAVEFANGGYQVSYDQLAAVDRSRPGDPVRMCLVSIPHPCPPGDARGRVYRTTNLRTGRSWRLMDSEHGCGGA